MKVHSTGGWIVAAVFLLIIAWQVVQAVFFGRMADLVSEDDDYVFFFDQPALFIVQFLVLVAVGIAIVNYGRKQYRKDQRRRMDTTPRHTHDARRSRKDG